MNTPTPSFPSEIRSEDLLPPPLPYAAREDVPVKDALARAGSAAMKFTDQIVEAGQAHPKTAAAVLLGTGMLIGSLMYRFVQPPTTTQRITRALKRGAIGAGRVLFGGIDSARHFSA